MQPNLKLSCYLRIVRSPVESLSGSGSEAKLHQQIGQELLSFMV